jgi:Fibronectin type III domain
MHPENETYRRASLASLMSSVFLIAACGGGGGSDDQAAQSTSTAPAPAPVPAPSPSPSPAPSPKPPAPAPAPTPKPPAPSPAPAPATGTATLAWNAPAAAVTGYRVYYGTSSRNYTQALGGGAYVTATTWTVKGLAGGKTYYFAVTAVDSSGVESAYSAEASKAIP